MTDQAENLVLNVVRLSKEIEDLKMSMVEMAPVGHGIAYDGHPVEFLRASIHALWDEHQALRKKHALLQERVERLRTAAIELKCEVSHLTKPYMTVDQKDVQSIAEAIVGLDVVLADSTVI